jgi:hypothetical protein
MNKTKAHLLVVFHVLLFLNEIIQSGTVCNVSVKHLDFIFRI